MNEVIMYEAIYNRFTPSEKVNSTGMWPNSPNSWIAVFDNDRFIRKHV